MKTVHLLLVIGLAFFGCDKPEPESIEPVAKASEVTAAAVSNDNEAKRDAEELASLEQAGRQILDEWVASQNKQDFATYQKLYASEFHGTKKMGDETKEFNRKAWLFDRQGMFTKEFVVVAENPQIKVVDGKVTIEFTQHWSSSKYADSGTKRLVVSKKNNALLIESEEMLSSSASRDQLPCEKKCAREICTGVMKTAESCWIFCLETECGENYFKR